MHIEKPRKQLSEFMRNKLRNKLLTFGLMSGIGFTPVNSVAKNHKQHNIVAPTHKELVFDVNNLKGRSVFKQHNNLVIPVGYKRDAIYHSAVKLKSLKRANFFKNTFRQEPKETYLAVEKYMVDYAEKNMLNPDLVKFIFYNRQFDLRNPLGMEYKGLIQKYAGKHVTKEDLENDPFLGIEVGVKYLTDIAKKHRISGLIPILTEYLYGSFSNKKNFIT